MQDDQTLHQRYRVGRLFPIFIFALVSTGQDPPPAAPTAPAPPRVLENSCKPMAPPLQCTLEDIRLAGLSCSEEDPCPTYLDLTAVEAQGSRIFAAGNIHSESVT